MRGTEEGKNIFLFFHIKAWKFEQWHGIKFKLQHDDRRYGWCENSRTHNSPRLLKASEVWVYCTHRRCCFITHDYCFLMTLKMFRALPHPEALSWSHVSSVLLSLWWWLQWFIQIQIISMTFDEFRMNPEKKNYSLNSIIHDLRDNFSFPLNNRQYVQVGALWWAANSSNVNHFFRMEGKKSERRGSQILAYVVIILGYLRF